MKQGAIFDMDGLLFDTERLYRDSWIFLAESFGQVPNPAFPKAVSGSSGAHMREIIHEYYPEVDAFAFQAQCYQRVAEQLEVAVPEKPGLHEILEGLHARGVKIAVASSSSVEGIEHNLRMAGIRDYFDAVVSASQVKNGKPAPDIFLYAAQQLGLKPEDCYVFEDSMNGIRAGAAAGCTTVMVPDLTAPTEDIRSICDAICSSLKEALDGITAGTEPFP